MQYEYTQPADGGQLILMLAPDKFERYYREGSAEGRLYTIVWNRGPAQQVTIDEAVYPFAANAILPIMMAQSFRFEHPEQLVAWQFNREFYCIVNHDAEVGCVGFVFYGPSPTMFVQLDEEHTGVMERLLPVFEEEFKADDVIKADMLRMLLVRLIIKVTRLAKKQYLGTAVVEDKFNLIRQFHLQVEIHFRQQHKVSFYAALLHKSPKTIANIFSLYSPKTPLAVIQERLITEARRQFYYTDKSISQVAGELGFEDPAHFSRFFRNHTGQTPTDLKRKMKS
jgi:AraC family transcriptional activator of pobA